MSYLKLASTLLVVIINFAAAPGRAQSPAGVPLPPDLSIVTPSDTLPPQVRQFSGKRFGTYSQSALDHVLVVEDIRSPDEVIAVYANGTSRVFSNLKAAWSRVTGKIDSTGLSLRLQSGAAVTYQLQPDGTLAGTYSLPGGFRGQTTVSKITMSRSKDQAN
jgi:hypothetical protein